MNEETKLKIADQVLKEAWATVMGKLIIDSNHTWKYHVKQSKDTIEKITGKINGMTIEQAVYYVSGMISVTATLLEKMNEKSDVPVHKLFNPLISRN